MTSWVHMTQGVGIVISDVQCHKVYRLGCFVIIVCNRYSLANTSSVPTTAFYVCLHTIKQQLMLKHLISTQIHNYTQAHHCLWNWGAGKISSFPVRPVSILEAAGYDRIVPFIPRDYPRDYTYLISDTYLTKLKSQALWCTYRWVELNT